MFKGVASKCNSYIRELMVVEVNCNTPSAQKKKSARYRTSFSDWLPDELGGGGRRGLSYNYRSIYSDAPNDGTFFFLFLFFLKKIKSFCWVSEHDKAA